MCVIITCCMQITLLEGTKTLPSRVAGTAASGTGRGGGTPSRVAGTAASGTGRGGGTSFEGLAILAGVWSAWKIIVNHWQNNTYTENVGLSLVLKAKSENSCSCVSTKKQVHISLRNYQPQGGPSFLWRPQPWFHVPPSVSIIMEENGNDNS